MCLVKTPSIPKPTDAETKKPLPVLRNPLLDGLLGNIAALRNGRNGLRIDRINPLAIPPGGIGGGGGNTIGGGGGGGLGGGGGGLSGGGGGTTGGTSTLSGGGTTIGGGGNLDRSRTDFR